MVHDSVLPLWLIPISVNPHRKPQAKRGTLYCLSMVWTMNTTNLIMAISALHQIGLCLIRIRRRLRFLDHIRTRMPYGCGREQLSGANQRLYVHSQMRKHGDNVVPLRCSGMTPAMNEIKDVYDTQTWNAHSQALKPRKRESSLSRPHLISPSPSLSSSLSPAPLPR